MLWTVLSGFGLALIAPTVVRLAPRLAGWLLASLRITWNIITPRHRMRPAILAIPLDLKTDLEITILANLITLTPGTLSLDVSSDRKVRFIHAVYVHDVDRFKRDIKHRCERRIKEHLR